MRNDHNAHRAGLGAPVCAAAVAPLGTAGAGPAAVAAEVKTPDAAGNSEGRGRDQKRTNDLDCQTAGRDDQAGIANVIASLARAGFNVRAAEGGFYATRWGQLVALPNAEALRGFAARVGDIHA